MADPFVAEVRLFPFNFAPQGWASCDGQLMPISQNAALFSLLGTTYGGNGVSNFALPNLQGRAAMQPGQGPGLSLHDLGETSGSETVALLESELPSHGHSLSSLPAPGDAPTPASFSFARTIGATPYRDPTGATLAAMAPEMLATSGSGLPHNNMQPYLTLSFCIALQGVYPPRT